jgi:dTDP-4-dehydrorhamnose reductase
LSVYGRSKLAGEVVVREILGEDALVVRTAWLYSSHGANFVRTMLRVMKERGEVRVVDDQIGSPTWARTLADSIWKLLAVKARGVQHVTDSGCVSWYEFAVAIRDLAVERGLLKDAQVHPIPTKDYPTAAQRPAYSVLDIQETFSLLGESAPEWRMSLAACLDEWTA